MKMAVNQKNIIKNLADEVSKDCKAQSISVEPEFVSYIIELLLLNPKYGKNMFAKMPDQNFLQYFVDQCVEMIVRGGAPLNTLKIQFTMITNYDKLEVLIDKHQDSIDTCLAPLLEEILNEDETICEVDNLKKVYRKIAIYIIMATGLGDPAVVMTLKEGMAALESVFSMEELNVFLKLPRKDRLNYIEVVLKISAGVRLFNRDCKKGGDMIQDLPFDLLDACRACIHSLSSSLTAVMQRVNTLTAAIEGCVTIHHDIKTVCVNIAEGSDLNADDYKEVFDLLILNRQFEVYYRRLLGDLRAIEDTSKVLVDQYRRALEEIHACVKYKEAVPCDTVFPMFMHLWLIWKKMQNAMYLVSTVNRLANVLDGVQENSKISVPTVEKMLTGKTVSHDEDIKTEADTLKDTENSLRDLISRTKFTPEHEVFSTDFKERHKSFLGFCVMSLNVGALVPSNRQVGVIKHRGVRYGFSNVKLASRFAQDPQRYINEVIQYARNNIHIIHLLNMEEMVRSVRDVDPLVETYVPKTVTLEKEIQTPLHPMEEFIDRSYTWDLWEWKRRACQWASIVNCRTHSTQTHYSHWRSEIHSQTAELRDKCEQTKKSTGINTNICHFYIWGLRGKVGGGQHSVDLVPSHSPDKPQLKPVGRCGWALAKNQ